MPIRIQSNQIQNPQQMEVVVAGPDEANRLIIINGQFDYVITAFSPAQAGVLTKETFSVLVGPQLTRRQFVQAIGTAALVGGQVQFTGAATGFLTNWHINNVDADWDDESGQVELRIEAQVSVSGPNDSATIAGFLFQ